MGMMILTKKAPAETMMQWEQDEEGSLQDGNLLAGTLRLIRSTCKAVQKQCSQQAGCHLMFKAYLESKGISTFPIAKFQGNRFNIIFYNAAGVFLSEESSYTILRRAPPHQIE